jgi:AraC-like DNA-binding protein
MSPVLLELPSHARGGLWYSTPASTRFGCHFHEELELNIVVTGAAHYWFPHGELRVVAPSALWIPPRVEHELLDSSSDLSLWVHSFRVRGGRAAVEPREPAALPLPDAAIRALMDAPLVTGIEPDALARICHRSRDGLLRPSAVEFDAILDEVFRLAWSGRRPPPRKQEPRACHSAALQAARLLRESDGSLSMMALAHRTALSRERLSRVFTQAYGIGLVQYKNHQRVQRFIRDYGHGTHANMLRSALDAGFGSYAQFHRAFKQVTSYAPAQHLERVREGIVDPARTGHLATDPSSRDRETKT